MREIKFRGKRLDNGEWVFGDLVSCSKKHAYIVTYFEKGEILPEEALTACKCVVYKVKAETVGQFTGLHDKNGKEIYESDIVKYTFDNPDSVYADENGLKVRIDKVFWQEWRSSFALGSKMANSDLFNYVRNGNRVEVIGNIHDNPELINDQKAEVENEY